MNNFKVGDKVRRIEGEHLGMKVGDTDVVTDVLEHTITLKNRPAGYHAYYNFEKIPQFKKGDYVVRINSNACDFMVGDVSRVEATHFEDRGDCYIDVISKSGKIVSNLPENLEYASFSAASIYENIRQSRINLAFDEKYDIMEISSGTEIINMHYCGKSNTGNFVFRTPKGILKNVPNNDKFEFRLSSLRPF